MEDIKKAIEVLRQGGIVIFPTDTAFGIGCRIDNEKSVQKLFNIRKRPVTQATPVLVDTVKMAQDYLEPIPQDVIDRLIEPYWPGALTIILPCKIEKVPSLVRGGRNTIGVRIPNYPITRELIREVGVPILGSSANFHNDPTPYEFADLDPLLVKLVDYVVKDSVTVSTFDKLSVNSAKQSLPAGRQVIEIASSQASRNDVRLASTIIDCSVNPWKILREGAVKVLSIKY